MSCIEWELQMGDLYGLARRLGAAILIAVLALSAGSCARKKKVRYTGIAVGREAAAAGEGREQERGVALLAHLVLSVTPRVDVRWQPSGSLERTVLPLWIPTPEAVSGTPLADLVRDVLRSLPRRWRRPSLKRLETVGLGRLEEDQIRALAAALRARADGDPDSAVQALRPFVRPDGPPILTYQMGAARLDAGDLTGAAALLVPLGESPDLPLTLLGMVRATRKGAAGEVREVLRILDSVVIQTPSLAEARWLRARLGRTDCSLYDAGRIEDDLRLALRSSPCCPSCALALAESAAFTGIPDEAARIVARERGCSEGALDSMLDRARSLALSAAARREGAEEAIARAEARDTNALLPGLAPAYLILGDHARLEETFDSEADARLAPAISVDHHFYSGLNDLWTGRPTAAAAQFERAEEHIGGLADEQVPSPARLQLVLALRIRAYLLAGRSEEAVRAARDAQARLRALNGYLAYTAGLADLASSGGTEALLRTASLTGTEEKFWRYLIRAQVALASGRLREAQTEISMALQGIDTQISFCPGVPAEAYLLEPQARLLLAQKRPRDAVRILDRLLGLGPRGLFAPDVIVPAWVLKGEALEALGDGEGAALAYQEVVARWGAGEETPAKRRALERLKALASVPSGGKAGPG